MAQGPATDLPLILHVESLIGDLLDRTQKFPKVVRFTFANRIDNLALDLLEALAEARFGRGRAKGALLQTADAKLVRLRVILRLAHDRSYLSHGGYEHVSRALDEAGRMLGGWRRQVDGGP